MDIEVKTGFIKCLTCYDTGVAKEEVINGMSHKQICLCTWSILPDSEPNTVIFNNESNLQDN